MQLTSKNISLKKIRKYADILQISKKIYTYKINKSPLHPWKLKSLNDNLHCNISKTVFVNFCSYLKQFMRCFLMLRWGNITSFF